MDSTINEVSFHRISPVNYLGLHLTEVSLQDDFVIYMVLQLKKTNKMYCPVEGMNSQYSVNQLETLAFNRKCQTVEHNKSQDLFFLVIIFYCCLEKLCLSAFTPLRICQLPSWSITKNVRLWERKLGDPTNHYLWIIINLNYWSSTFKWWFDWFPLFLLHFCMPCGYYVLQGVVRRYVVEEYKCRFLILCKAILVIPLFCKNYWLIICSIHSFLITILEYQICLTSSIHFLLRKFPSIHCYTERLMQLNIAVQRSFPWDHGSYVALSNFCFFLLLPFLLLSLLRPLHMFVS